MHRISSPLPFSQHANVNLLVFKLAVMQRILQGKSFTKSRPLGPLKTGTRP